MGSFGGKLSDTSDAELLAAHIAGDRYAFEELVRRHRRLLYRLARVRSNDPRDADDALQDALLKAHCHAPRFRHDSSVRSWLSRIVVNSCVDRLRHNSIYSTDELRDDACSVPGPAHHVEMVVAIERALLRLPVEQRAAVVAVDMQGYSVAETAAMLGIAEGTVKSRCSRARAKLARSLAHLAQQPD
ncbi:RNA polymerase sigma factor SigM [Mycobacterium sp. ST-F2]|uniref:RNA polymerase sigma factor SigM n=1 Tax=Mycobacterium sp. ST-F2 TaxID=1490484 RepID=UPI00093C7EEA|nr:RNA polymerase sigma factor SigM [Mycobacterium sp. ST-F2]OKH84256.1 RNA polymerase sigma factor SigM [Mycobacterium sp. ST-F2]